MEEKASHTKKLTQEKIYLADRKEPILLDRRSPLLFLLQNIRDEAHRVAITFHKKKRAQKLIKSELEQIPGIGPTKQRILLKQFKSIANIKKTPLEELKKTKKLTQTDIRNIVSFLKKE